METSLLPSAMARLRYAVYTMLLATGIISSSIAPPALFAEPVRLKDIASFAGRADVRLFGYGLVVGLQGTGDGAGTQFTVQSLASMLTRLGITVTPEEIKVKNVAAVMVTSAVTTEMKTGSHFDVMVSSMGDAQSLQGGVLLLTPLTSLDGQLFAYAQGPVSTGGFNVEAQGGGRVSKNYTLVGRVPGGGVLEKELALFEPPGGKIKVLLRDPDYTTARRVAEVINAEYPDAAAPADQASVEVRMPGEYQEDGGKVAFISSLESLTLTPDMPARVVINEKTGTIVAGEHVTIAPVALAHGNITIQIRTRPIISQPPPFSKGETVTQTQADIEVTETEAPVVYKQESTNIHEVAQALNSIGATSRDIIAIFQALKKAGALRAELVSI
jgi:flagellar P-ring protein precursor FlgI